MVGNHHQIANLEARVHATCGIRNKEGLNTQLVHHTNGEGYLLHRVALVVVETTLHRHDVYTAKLTKDKFAAVAFYCRNGEVGYLTVGNLLTVSYF